ncbi:Ropporin-1-like protein [Trichoplax sp. H2]|uniref:Ropporin-1-like protein n=1 Tax=Trichoplax adhaerens TaxID=10228 RepID=B3S7U1_TRIAD|nr:hypothetical protein TRIADDRAFT_60293 [Trichoplax adhaerens]EDV21252.1 hypothetical protein TRIADDRAFT_60293 [Trichoplax adhaerens]RDD47631.1 Ropporin-1-like protein [Trichoplax sp. H2]|eukprot:XP_002116219.1 hypothetical protein TRIADDRAFT_60293 [Trichoplax adhaerens]
MQSALTGQDEPIYCSQQIKIPPQLPDMLKKFTKAAIRTQPTDLLQWSYAYFDALSQGEQPPIKERLELPPPAENILSIGLLKILNKQLRPIDTIKKSLLLEKWKNLNLSREKLAELCNLGNFQNEFKWLEFLCLACSDLSPNLTETMKIACSILTKDEEGGPDRIIFSLFLDLYRYLASFDDSIDNRYVDNVIQQLEPEVEKSDGLIGPRHFTGPISPKLSPEF